MNQYQTEARCDLSDLFKSQCSHCTGGYPTLGPMHGELFEDEEEVS